MLFLAEVSAAQDLDIDGSVTIKETVRVEGRLDALDGVSVSGSLIANEGSVFWGMSNFRGGLEADGQSTFGLLDVTSALDVGFFHVRNNSSFEKSAQFFGTHTTISHPAISGGDAGLVIRNREILTDQRFWRFYVQHGDGDMLLYSSRINDGTTAAGEFKAVTGQYNVLSDRRVKKNLETPTAVLSSFRDLNVYKYNMISETDSASKHYGLIAQEVQEYFPELVHYDEESDIYRLEYSTLGVLAIQAIKEQQEEIDELKKLVMKLADRLEEK